MTLAERVQEFLQRLTPVTRSSLLNELERLEGCGAEIPGSSAVMEKLRAEFRKGGQAGDRMPNPPRYFFAPLAPLLVEGAPEHANSGRIQRGSLVPIWEWISRDLLPTMARDYIKDMNELVAGDNLRQAKQAAATFQTKVVKSLESTLGTPDGPDNTRAKLATYTASRAAYDDLVKMMCALSARDALAKFESTLPDNIPNLDDARVARITELLDEFRKTNPEALAFAIALVAARLKTQWHLIRLATRPAASKNATDIAATPYALAVSMVLDRVDDWRSALRIALKNNRVLVAKELLTEIYDTEYALQARIDQLEQSEWGQRLSKLTDAISTLVAAEVSRFPANVGHVLGSRSLRGHHSLAGRLTYLARKGRDTLSESAAHCMRLIRPSAKSRA